MDEQCPRSASTIVTVSPAFVKRRSVPRVEDFLLGCRPAQLVLCYMSMDGSGRSRTKTVAWATATAARKTPRTDLEPGTENGPALVNISIGPRDIGVVVRSGP